MNKYINRNSIFALMLAMTCFMMSACGDDDDTPAPEPAPAPAPTPEPAPVVQKIDNASIIEDASHKKVQVYVKKQEGGKAVVEGKNKAATKEFTIDGIYDDENSCYVFDLSTLEGGDTYNYKVAVYDGKNQKIQESDKQTISIPESADTDKEGTGGGSEGMRGGAVIVK
jgi:hypothetical protein